MDYSFTTHIKPDITNNKINITFEAFRDGVKIEPETFDGEPIVPFVVTLDNISDEAIVALLDEFDVPIVTPENKEAVEQFNDVAENNASAIISFTYDLVAEIVRITQIEILRIAKIFNTGDDELEVEGLIEVESEEDVLEE